MDPVFHVATLPRVITPLAFLESTRGIELIREAGCFQRNVKSFERGVLGYKWFFVLNNFFDRLLLLFLAFLFTLSFLLTLA